MKHYLTTDSQVLGFEDDGSQDHLVPDGAKALNSDEFDALMAERSKAREPDAAEVAKARLIQIDQQKIRAISDALITGDKSRLEALEKEAAALRSILGPPRDAPPPPGTDSPPPTPA